MEEGQCGVDDKVYPVYFLDPLQLLVLPTEAPPQRLHARDPTHVAAGQVARDAADVEVEAGAARGQAHHLGADLWGQLQATGRPQAHKGRWERGGRLWERRRRRKREGFVVEGDFAEAKNRGGGGGRFWG